MALKMDGGLLALKIKALLHDPPQKAGILFSEENHESVSGKLFELLGLTKDIPELVKQADRLAAAADRLPIPGDRSFRVEFEKDPCLTHPLSGETFRLTKLASTQWKTVTSFVEDCVREIGQKYPDNLAQKYLAVWRLLPEMLEDPARKLQAPNDYLGLLWRFMPADTRIPDHTIWEHNRVASAIVGALPEPALFQFSIGPVQSFIAAARKTSDLWAGSSLLATLTAQAIIAVAEACGPDSIVFPDIWGNPEVDAWLRTSCGLEIRGSDFSDIPSIPNQFLAVIPRDSAPAIAEAAQKNVRDFLTDRTKDLTAHTALNRDDADALERHIQEAFEFYWAAVPFPAIFEKDSKERFAEWWKNEIEGKLLEPSGLRRKVMEDSASFVHRNSGLAFGDVGSLAGAALASVKATRLASRSQEPEADPTKHKRCALCGERGGLDASARETGFLRPGEKLCGVCLLKRWWGRLRGRGSFPSTASVATASWLLELFPKMRGNDREAVELKQAFSSFASAAVKVDQVWIPDLVRNSADNDLRDLVKFDGRLLFQDMYQDDEFQAREDAQDALGKLKKLDDVLRKLRIPKARRYYAIIVGDGDSMGKWVSGKQCPEFFDVVHPKLQGDLGLKATRPYSPAYQAALSRAMRDFAREAAPRIVEQLHPGALVYAGGDDFFALAPIRNAHRLAGSLRAAFAGGGGSMGDDLLFDKGFGLLGRGKRQTLIRLMGEKATLSAGIALAHFKTPMRVAIDAARAAEKLAKRAKGKNALCIATLKRSGEQDQVLIRWDAVPLLEKTAAAFHEADLAQGAGTWRLSPRIVRDLDKTVSLLRADRKDALTQAEVRRLFRRHAMLESGDRDKSLPAVAAAAASLADELLASLEDKLVQPRKTEEEAGGGGYFAPERQLVRFVSLAAFLVREDEE